MFKGKGFCQELTIGRGETLVKKYLGDKVLISAFLIFLIAT